MTVKRRRIKTPQYLSNLFERIFAQADSEGSVSKDDVESFQRQERARVGGLARAEKARTSAEATVLADGPDDGDSYQQTISEVRSAVRGQFGDNASVMDTFPTHVVYAIYASLYDSGSKTVFYDQQYSEADDVISFGDRKEVERNTTWVAADGSDGDADENAEDSYENLIQDVDEAITKRYGTSCYALDTYPTSVIYCSFGAGGGKSTYYRQSYTTADDVITLGDRTEVERSVSWDSVMAQDALQLMYQKSGASGSAAGGKTKLPANVNKLPDKLQQQWTDVWNSTYERCTKKGGADGDCQKAAYESANGVLKKRSVKAEDDLVDTPTEATPAVAQLEDNTMSFTVAAIRLADEPGGDLPVWQQIHKKGTWAVPHPSGLKVQLTQETGDQMIRNFEQGVLRRGVPLDEAHMTDAGGHALGWVEQMCWGGEGEGLLGDSPSGVGDILYARFKYTPVGEQKLADEEFAYFSPQYAFNYQDKESGLEYGYTLMAVAATNNPYLRLRSAQGEPAREPVAILSDGLVRPHISQESAPMTTPQADASAAAAAAAAVTPAAASLSDAAQAKFSEMEVKLAAFEKRAEQETAAREAVEARLLDSEKQRHKDSVDAYINGRIDKGLMIPAAELARVALMNSAPAAEQALKLGDGDEARTLNLHSLVKELIELFPLVPVGEVKTHSDDARPGTTPAAALADQQVLQDFGRELLADIGVPVGAGRNGKATVQPEGGVASIDE